MAIPLIISALGIGVKAWQGYSKIKKAKLMIKAKKQASKVRKAKDQPKKGQKEMFKGEAGHNVKRPEGKVKDGWYERANKQGDLFDKKVATKLEIKQHKK